MTILNIALFLSIIYATAFIGYVLGWFSGRYRIMNSMIRFISLFFGILATYPMTWFDIHYLPFYSEGRGGLQFLVILISVTMNIYAMWHGFSVGEQARRLKLK